MNRSGHRFGQESLQDRLGRPEHSGVSRWLKHRRAICLLAVLCLAADFLLLSSTALAQSCSATSPTINFGNVEFVSGTNYSTTGTISVTCTVPVGSGPYNFSVCLNIGLAGSGSWRTMTSGSNSLSYNLYQDAAHTTIWGSYYSMPPNPVVLNIHVNSPFDIIYQGGSTTVSTTIYAYIQSSVNTTVPAGSYLQDLTGSNTALNVNMVTDPFTPIACTSGGGVYEGTFPFTTTATVINNCLVSATNVNFGTAPGVLSSAVTATGNITATCSNNHSYTIALNQGSTSGASLTDRRMAGSGAAVVHYELYTSSGYTTVWGDGTSGTGTVSGTGNNSAQSYTVYGRVPAQSPAAGGSYSDTITVTVTY